MRVDDLLNFYRADRRAHLLNACWENEGSKAELKGIVGSAPALLAASMLSPGGEMADDSALRDAPSHLFVLDDKESAAYFLNDLQQLIGDTHNVLFFPRSARVPYQEEVTENANIAMRAEVLNEINRHGKGLAIVTFGEAIAEQVISKRELSEQTFALALG
ncbi:MAG: transcription-repair coupling factor, partial [Flavobacteriales bacterium]